MTVGFIVRSLAAVIAELENEMTEAAARLEFEHAATLRDQIQALRKGDFKRILDKPKGKRKRR